MLRADHPAARLAGLALGAGSLVAFRVVGDELYQGYRFVQGVGMTHPLPDELAFILLFTVFGLTATLGFSIALMGAQADAARRLFARVAGRAGIAVFALAALTLCASVTLSDRVLSRSVITDDEHVYRFIARTLNTGALTGVSPGGDYEFFAEQFVVMGPKGRYGKYPFGYPLLLAVGQRLGLEALVVPLLTALLVPLTFALGAKLLDRGAALLAALLVAISPQVLVSGATWLSQPASAACLAAALPCLIAWDRGRRTGLLAAAGALLGYGIVVRPLPHALFALVALAWTAWRLAAERRGRAARTMLALALPLALAVAALLWCNAVQSGSPWTSGYQAFHRPGEQGAQSLTHLGGSAAATVMSVVGSLLRLDVWMLGWPVSFAFLYLGRRLPGAALLWSMVGAALAYRVVSPKVGVGGAGSLYFFEVLPILCLISAHGIVVAARSKAWRHATPAAVLGSTVVALTLFLPPRLADLQRMGDAQALLPRLLARQKIHNALVFHRGVVPPSTGLSWAYFPRCNGPGLDDDVLFVQLQVGGDMARNFEFWQRRYPSRSAWAFLVDARGPRLVPLDEAGSS
jgi:hypothetical protein